jgi:two-component system alkaline phosphatase synthesis response regulator PhoP
MRTEAAPFFRSGCQSHEHLSRCLKTRILIVEDEPGLLLVLSDLLRAEGHAVETATHGDEGLIRGTTAPFDLVILDLMLPGLDGLEVCRALREQGFEGAILILTARGQVQDRVEGLQRGADDYLTKPFHPDELVARVKALLRRVHKDQLTPVARFQFGNVQADFTHNRIQKDGKPIPLAAKERDLLRFLINRRGQVLSRESILKAVWREQPFITPRTVDVHIAWLRQKLENDPGRPKHILTVRGEGYRFSG